jgi:pimeloyl-ACP methyl ester carboxylesterase
MRRVVVQLETCSRIAARQGIQRGRGSKPVARREQDAAYVSSILNTIAGPIIRVGHSYGGAVITNAAQGNQSVKALVYVAAFAPDTGESVATPLRRFPGNTVEANTAAPIVLADGSRDLYLQPEKFRVQFAADLPETEMKLLALAQRPLAERAMTEASDVAARKPSPLGSSSERATTAFPLTCWHLWPNVPDRRRPPRLKEPHTPS